MRIDLHTHSVGSDGSDTPSELVERSVQAGLDVVALTDHDTVTGWAEAAEAGERLGVRVIRGIEFSTTNEGHGQHLLGYNLDPDHPAVADILTKAAASREGRIPMLLARLDVLGLSVDRDYVMSLAGGIPSRKHVAAGLVHARHAADDNDAFARLLNEGCPAYIQRFRPTIEETITAIRDAGGASVIAHPRDGKRGPGISEARFAALAAGGLNGIEVDHQSHSPEVRAELRSIAANLGLVATGASDFHGTRKTDHDLGCNVTGVDAAVELLGHSIEAR